MDLKFRIAKIIGRNISYRDHIGYQELIKAIYNNRYTDIDKCPIDLYFCGLVNSFVINDIAHANKILNVVKEVTKDILESNEIELTFVDYDWEKIRFIPNEGWNKENVRFTLLKTDKNYMCELYEI